MKETNKTNNRTKDKVTGGGAVPKLKFNYVKREALPQTRIDVRALEMVRAYPLYVKQLTDHEPPIGEILEQCIITTLSTDTDFVEWLEHQPHAEIIGEQNNNSTSTQKESAHSE